MSELGRFQDAFGLALEGDPSALEPWDAGDAAALSVYRNTVLKGAVDALVATCPTVEMMVGEPWLRASATVYARDHAPRSPALQTYGFGFPDWLETFPPAADTPYLAAVARLDGLWWASYFAADATALAADAFVDLTSEALACTGAQLHPSVRLAALDQTIASLWLAHQAPAPLQGGFEIGDDPEWIIFARPGLEVKARKLDRASFAFFSACANGECLLAAAERALAADGSAQLSDIIAIGLELGAFGRLEPSTQGETSP
jgi:hypothetical protein